MNRFIFSIIQLFILSSFQCTSQGEKEYHQGFLETKEKSPLEGTWECTNRMSVEVSNQIQKEAFPFWMKIVGKEILISNSNNRRISDMGMSWNYLKGNWSQQSDTLIVWAKESRAFSTNTGSYHKPPNVFEKPHILKFLVTELSENKIELAPLHDFLAYTIMRTHTNPPYIQFLSTTENLYMIKTKAVFYFNDKL